MSVIMLSNTMKATKQELLERVIKLETLVQKLEQQIKDILESCSYVKLNLPKEAKRDSDYLLPLNENFCFNCYEEKEMKLPDETEKHED